MKRTILAMLILAATAHASLIPWMSTSFGSPANFFSIHLQGQNPKLPQIFDFTLNLTVGKFQPVRSIPGFSENEAPLLFDITGTLTNTRTGHIQQFKTINAIGGVDYQDYTAPNSPKQVYFYDYVITGAWGNSGLSTRMGGTMEDTVYPHGDPATSGVGFNTYTPEPLTLLTLGTGLLIAARKLRTP